MGTSTVSGPFRSANGFQELVNGQWVPVAGSGGGGGNPNDIVVSGEIYAGQPGNIYGGCYNSTEFIINTNLTMGDIQSSLSSNGKWACFSGYTIEFYQSAVSNPNIGYQGFQYSCLISYQVANCVCELTGPYGGFYVLVNNDMGSIDPHPYSVNSGCYGVGGLSTYINWVSPAASFCSDGVITTGRSCSTPANSLSCPAFILFSNQYAFSCGNNGPAIKYTLRLHFERLINWP